MANGFSKLHPKDLLERIIADGAAQNKYVDVYIVSETGLCNRDAFICTALQNSSTASNNRDAFLCSNEVYDIGNWSTSCFILFSKIKGIYKLTERRGHSPAILKGTIFPETGYSIITNERASVIKGLVKQSRGHVDWWIFENIDVSCDFTIVDSSEIEKEV